MKKVAQLVSILGGPCLVRNDGKRKSAGQPGALQHGDPLVVRPCKNLFSFYTFFFQNKGARKHSLLSFYFLSTISLVVLLFGKNCIRDTGALLLLLQHCGLLLLVAVPHPPVLPDLSLPCQLLRVHQLQLRQVGVPVLKGKVKNNSSLREK